MAKIKNDKVNDHSKSLIYAVLGIIISFISIVALFNWGFLGSLILNTFRLFVGEAYDILLLSILMVSINMIVKRNIINIAFRKLIGFSLIFIAITTVLHFNYFDPLEPLSDSVFSLTFDIFRNEFLTGQNQLSLAGGLLGALFYQSFGYLFGKWGTYLLATILFFIGLFLLVNITIDMVIKSFGAIFKSISHLFKGIINSFKEAKTAYVDSFDKDDIVSDEDTEEDTDNFIQDYSYERIQNRDSSKTMMERVKTLFFGTFEQEDNYSSEFEENFETVHSFQDSEQSDMNPYQRETNYENDRQKEAEKDLVIDLDYFEQENSGEKSIVPKNNYNKLKEEFEETDNHRSDINSASSASHWQSQSTTIQDTTFDELDEVLKASDLANSMSPQKKKILNKKSYQLPPKSLLTKIPPVDQSEEYKRINENIVKLERTFDSFGVDAKVVKANLGPAVTKYEIQPAIGVKVSKIVSLSDDIALALAARDVRIEAPIPGKSLIGIEVPNIQVSPVSFWEIINAALESDNLLEVPLGRDISGSVCLADLSKMPHLLIAGATGSGKSVGMNVIIASLLMKAKPEEVKFLMIDPKKVELTLYNELPHLLSPVVTNPRKAAKALNNVVQEMEKRYELFAETGVRNIDSYNDYADEENKTKGLGVERLAKIIVFIDELADLMMVAGNEVENAIIRLAQMARAAGIHMIIATQRPSVDVITGIIKANVPSRLAFAVSSGTDSRTILDGIGAEKLLGKGDMLFQPMGRNKPLRVQGAYISDNEVERITDFIKAQSEPEYDQDIVVTDETMEAAEVSDDEYFEDAIEMIRELETVSISQLQRKYRIGYNRAARLIDDLEALGYVSEPDGSKPRQVLIDEIV